MQQNVLTSKGGNLIMMYEVEAKFGHVGKNRYIIKTVPVIAPTGAEAAAAVRNMPRVKHHHPDAIRQVRIVDAPRYWELVQIHEEDPYFHCRSIQEQRALCPELECFQEHRTERWDHRKNDTGVRPFYVGKQRIRHPRRYLNKYYDCEDYAA